MKNTVRLEGKVKNISQNHVTMETADHKSYSVKITNATKFFKGNKPSSLSEMKTGDHVVFDAEPTTDAAMAETTTTTDTHQDSISVGLSFSAVEASY